MFLSDTSIDRPVLAIMVIGAFVLAGVLSFYELPLREMPDVSVPVVNVSVNYPGANPEVVEEEVTEPIEEVVNTVEGIDTLSSSSNQGQAQVTAEFNMDRDIDVAVQEVRDEVSSARGDLPDSSLISEPVIERVDPDEQPVMWISINSQDRDRIELATLAETGIKPELERLSGVGRIEVGGLQEFAVRVRLQPDRMAAYNVTTGDIRTALESQNQELAGGMIEGRNREYRMRIPGNVSDLRQFQDVVIRSRDTRQITLGDVATIERGAANERVTARFTKQGEYVGREGVGIGIVRQSGSNTVAVIDRVKEQLDSIRENLPAAVTLEIASDDSVYIRQSINNLQERLLFGALLAAFIVLLFLASGRPGIITVISIPTAIISSFTLIHFMGMSLNNLTMLAMVLAVGIVVDDSVVVMENIFRHREEGASVWEAAREGAAEISFAVLAAASCVAVVFTPLLFVSGIIGEYFWEFSLSVTGAIAMSYLVALTIIPMLASRFLREDPDEGWFYRTVHGTMESVSNGYARLLEGCLQVRWLVLLVAVGLLGSTYFLVMDIGRELSPDADIGQFLIMMDAPEGSTVHYTAEYLDEVEELVSQQEEVNTMFSAVGLMGGPSGAIGFVRLDPLEERQEKGQRSQQELIRDLRGELSHIPGFLAFPTPMQRGGAGGGKPLQIVVQHDDYEALFQTAQIIEQRMSEVEGIVDVDSNLNLNRPEIGVSPDRARAADLGIPLTRIGNTLRVLTGGDDITEFEREGDRFDVMVQLEDEERNHADQIESMYIRGENGRQVPLSSVVNIREGTGPATIHRHNRARSVTIDANTEGIALGEAVDQSISIAENVAQEELTEGYSVAPTGQSQDMREMFDDFLFMFLLATVAIYMLLAAQFDHFVHPLTIMMSLPLCLFGSISFLWLLDFTLNVASVIGILMLFGIILRNSILLVDYARMAQRKWDQDLFTAAVEAGRIRLRPILMTGLSTIGAVLPVLFGVGSGAEIQQPMAASVVGGMIAGNVLTLFLVPVVYTYFGQFTAGVWWLIGSKREEDGSESAPDTETFDGSVEM